VIKLEVKASGDPEFFVLDIIRINIINSKTYSIPKVRIRIHKEQGKSAITFEPLVQTDKTSAITSYSWTFGDGNTSSEKSPTHSYTGENFTYLISLKVTDTNGFISYGGVLVSSLNGKMTFEDPFTQGKSYEIAQLKTTHVQKNNKLLQIIVGILGVGIVGIIIIKLIKK